MLREGTNFQNLLLLHKYGMQLLSYNYMKITIKIRVFYYLFNNSRKSKGFDFKANMYFLGILKW